MISVDDFYDEKLGDFSGEKYSKTDFSYEVVSRDWRIFTIKNKFHVEAPDGRVIFHREPLYGIDSVTWKHAKGFWDTERDGYLFAPRWLKKWQSFSYWHVSSNQPSEMEYVGERFAYGIKVLRYESKDTDPVDQTDFMHFLPDVPESRGVKLSNKITMWIEPISWHVIKIEEISEDYFYFDIKTGQKLFPYNQFINTYTDDSVRNHVKIALKERNKIVFIQILVPISLFVIVLFFFVFHRFTHIALFSREHVIPIIIFLIGIVATLSVFIFSRNNITEREEEHFSSEASKITEILQNRMNIYANLLAGWRGFFSGSSSVERDEWHAYVESLDIWNNYPGIQGLGFSKVLTLHEKDDFIAAVRKEGFPDFTITPEGMRDEYTSILFLEPFDEKNKRAFGFDMFTETNRRKAMIRARDSGAPALSGNVILKQETDVNMKNGFLLYFPVYKWWIIPEKLEDRRANILGYVYSPFRMNDFIQWALSVDTYDVAFEIYDGLKVSNEKKLYSTPISFLPSDQEQITFRTLQTIYFSGHPWIIMYSNSPSFVRDSIYTRLSYGLLAIGFVVSSLLFFMVYTVTGSRKRAIIYAEKMNRKLIKNVAELEHAKQDVVSTLEDVEMQKSELSQTATRLKLATKSAKIGVWDWDIIKNVITWDDQMYKIYGIKPDKFGVVYDTWQKGLHPDDRTYADSAIQLAAKGEKDFNIQFRVIWPNGEIRSVQAYALVVRDVDGKPLNMVGINRDITNELKIDKQKTEFVSIASHQLRTPLTAISWYAEMMLHGDAGKLEPQQKKYLNEIYHSNKLMVELVNRLLNVSRIDLGTLKIESKQTNINELIRDVVSEQKKKIKEKKIMIEEKYLDIPIFYSDPTMLRMVLQNIFANALAYTSIAGKIILSIAQKNKKEIVVTISDTGCGIPDDQQKEVFHKFFRADNVKNSNWTGLGLYIAKSIIEKLGGKISFESHIVDEAKQQEKNSSGTTFFITIPLWVENKKT